MAIQWTGLFANTGYSSANNKTQDDAVTGMQDTLYVTGPGYGAYEAVVRLYNSTGALVASVNVSGGGGALSAPPPVRFVDNGTVYSYSLEVVRGYIPTEDADGIVIRLVGGASKRFPSPMAVTPSGDVQFGGAAYASKKTLASTLTSGNLWDGTEALIDQYLDNDGTVKALGGYAVSNYIAVNPGDKLLICLGQLTLDKPGGYYNGTTWVGPLLNSNNTDGLYTVPAGCNAIRISMYRSNQAGYVPVYVYKTDKQVRTKAYAFIGSIGDSICRGYKASKPFTTVIAEALGIASANVDNNGIDSSTIAQSANNPISARMTQINPLSDLILFEGGGNDFNLIPAPLGTIADTANTTFYGACNVCAKYLREKFPFATIVWVTVPRWQTWATLNSQSLTMDAYMDAFKAVAVKNGFVVADGYTKMSIDSYPIGKMIASDYAHLTDLGHALLADIVMKAIGE